MKYYLHETAPHTFEVRLDNETFDSRTGEAHEPLLMTVQVHNTSGLHHINNWISWQNILLDNQAAALAAKNRKKPQTSQEETNAKGTWQERK